MAYRKTNAAKQRKKARRRLFLDAAIDLFAKHGYYATTVPMIVHYAHSSTGSFYKHFRNKEDAFVAALKEIEKKVLSVRFDFDGDEPNSIDRLVKNQGELFLLLSENPEFVRLLALESFGIASSAELTRQTILAQKRKEVNNILKAIQPEIPYRRTAGTACCLMGVFWGTLYCWLFEDPHTRLPRAEMARCLAEFSVQAVGRPGKK
jgi:AcrR family transcriptional regulator